MTAPPVGGRLERRLLAACWAFAVAALFALFHGLRHDDAFITFQYARHLGSGEGWVFNPGERVLGFTSPLHALLLAAGYLVVGDRLPGLAIFLGACALATQGLLVYLLLAERSRRLAGVLGACVVLGLASAHSWLALETNLYAAAVLGAVWASHRRWPRRTGVLLGLAFLCRMDGVLLVPILAFGWRKDRSGLQRVLLGALLTVLPWLAFATAYFGSFLPNTFFAKRALTPTATYLAHALTFFAEEPWRSLFSGPPAWALSAALWIAGAVFVVRAAKPLVPLLAFAAAQLLGYSVIGPPMLQHWHLYVPSLALSLLAALGLFGGLASLPKAAVSALPATGVAVGVALAVQAVAFSRAANEAFWLGGRHRHYVEVATFYREHVRPGQPFLALEVGTLGYLTRAPMVDALGLIGEPSDFARSGSFEDFVALLEERHPGVTLVDSIETARELERRTPYRTVRVFDPAPGPWSTLLVRSSEVLQAPGELGALRSQLPRR